MADTIHGEIGAHPADWSIQRVDSLFDIQQGKSVSKAHREGNNQKPFLRTKNILWGQIDFTELDEMHFTSAEEVRLKLQAGDLLLCEGGDVGRTAIWKDQMEACYYQNHLHRLRARAVNEVDPQFALFWFWYAFEVGNIYIGRSNVTTIPNLSQSKLSELLIPKPQVDEQRRIAHVLATVNTAIEQQMRLIAVTRELKSALMRKLFTEGLRGEKQRETEIGLIPESWKVVELNNVSEKPQYGFTESAQDKGTAQFLRITDIQEFGVNWSDVPYCECPENLIDKYLLKNGDLVFARIGATTGKSVVMNNPPKAVFASYLIRIRPYSEGLDSDFLAFYCQTQQYWQQIDSHKGNNLKGGVNSGILQKLLVPLPKTDEQQEISQVLTALDSRIDLARKRVLLHEDLFRTLLHQLMTGQTRVNKLDFGAFEARTIRGE